MLLNRESPKIVHFHYPSIPKSICCFKCVDVVLDIVNQFTLLGNLLHDTLHFNITVKGVSQFASVLGLLIAKSKLWVVCHMMFSVNYTIHLYYPLLLMELVDGGIKEYSVVNKVQNSDCRRWEIQSQSSCKW